MASGGSGSTPGSAAPTSPSAPHTAHHHGDTTTTISVRDSCELLRKLAAEMIVGGADAIAPDDLSKRLVSIAVDLILNQAGQSSAAGEHASRRRAPLLARSDDIADAIVMATALARSATEEVRASVVECLVRLAFRPLLAASTRDVLLREPSSRTALKLVGGMIGSLTVALDKPLLFRTLSVKALLAHPKHCWTAIPALCKLLERCSCSRVFRLPNPWTAAMLRELREVVSAEEVSFEVLIFMILYD